MDAIIGVRGTSDCFALSEINIVVYVVLSVSIHIDSQS